MGFAAIARATKDDRPTLGVFDKVSFGLAPEDELEAESTICHEVRQANKMVAIDHIDKDKIYCGHPTPLRYGFQNYITVPVDFPLL